MNQLNLTETPCSNPDACHSSKFFAEDNEEASFGITKLHIHHQVEHHH